MTVTKTWVVTSSNPRPSHDAIDGETIGMDETFSNGLAYPGDQSTGDPGETANCSCVMAIEGEATAATPEAQREAVSFYQGAGHSEINTVLRDQGVLSPELRRTVEALKNAATPMEADANFYRGVLHYQQGGVNPSFSHLEGRVGEEFTDLGFLSVTTDKEFADMVSGLGAGYSQGDAGYTVKVVVRKGSQMVQINDKLMHEYVSLPGTRYKLVKGAPNPVIEIVP